MQIIRQLLLTLIIIQLSACGGATDSADGNTQGTKSSTSSARSTEDSVGGFHFPASGKTFDGNLLVDIEVSDKDGLEDVYLSFNGHKGPSLCNSEDSCSGTQLTTMASAIYPGDYDVSAGMITLGLWVKDLTGADIQVSTIDVDWQPKTISDLVLTRSEDNTSVAIDWQHNPQLLRYNLYIAAQSGVNQQNYSSLDEGQAILAIDDNQQLVSGLDPNKVYYVLLVGIDGSGESAFSQERLIQLNNSQVNAPIAMDDTYSMFVNTQFASAKSSGLLINDSDPNDLALTVNTQALVEPSSGALTLAEDGSFTYIPNTDFVGTDTFTYQIQNVELLTDIATVNIEVKPISADLLGDSSSMTGEFLYIGLGELTPGSGIGTGSYRIGNCIQIVDTFCTMSGEYVESASSGNQPDQTGRYAFTMTYSGTGNSPVIARSVTAGSNVLNFTSIGDARFELNLFPSTGGVIQSVYAADTFSTLLNFGAFIKGPQVCQGLPAGESCDIGTLGLYAGATESAPLDRLNFTVSGYATVDISNEPVAKDDAYQVVAGQRLHVAEPGVLLNDIDYDFTSVGDTLTVRNQMATGFSQPIALAVDGLRQVYYIYSGFNNEIHIHDRAGTFLGVLTWPGEGANEGDIDVAPEAFSMAGISIPQGSVLVFNGETDETEIYAIYPDTNAQLAVLNTDFGNSHVVGGAFNPVTNTFFLLQDNVPGGNNANVVAEIDPSNGEVLNSFLINQNANLFDVSYGDLSVNNLTGNLYLVSSIENRMIELSPEGSFIRYMPLPTEVASPSGFAMNNDLDRAWFVNNSATSPVYETEFSNQGSFPTMLSTLLKQSKNGQVELNLDGSFSYQPNPGFVGQDSFTYQVADQTGKVAQATVQLNVQ